MRRAAPIYAFVFLAATVLATVSARSSQAAEVEELKRQGYHLYLTHYEEAGRLPLAILMYEKAIEKAPDDYDALWNLAMMCQIYGQTLPEDQRERKLAIWDKGKEYGKRAIKANAQGKEGYFYYMSNLGSAVRTRGKLTSFWNMHKIKKAMDKTLELDPDFAPALVARGQYLTHMPGIFGGSKEEAMRLYQQAVAVDPRYYVAYYYIAEMYAKDGRYEEAVVNLNKVLQCPEEDRAGSWATVDRVWAEQLLREIMEKKQAWHSEHSNRRN